MPEYLAPGVYLEESDAEPKSIPGVTTSTLDFVTAQRLVAVIRPIVEQTNPDWTDFNHSDPGVTLVQWLAHAAESQLYRTDSGFDERRQAVFRILRDATEAARTCSTELEPLRRPRYFAGRLLDAATMQLEQDYHREKRRRHNRHLHGHGIVSGLAVRVESVDGATGDRVVIAPGYAIDACGNEIAVPECARIAAPATGDFCFVAARYGERPGAPSPSPTGVVDYGMTEEATLLALVASVLPPRMALARLVRLEGRWSVDPAFVVPRVRTPS